MLRWDSGTGVGYTCHCHKECYQGYVVVCTTKICATIPSSAFVILPAGIDTPHDLTVITYSPCSIKWHNGKTPLGGWGVFFFMMGQGMNPSLEP